MNGELPKPEDATVIEAPAPLMYEPAVRTSPPWQPPASVGLASSAMLAEAHFYASHDTVLILLLALPLAFAGLLCGAFGTSKGRGILAGIGFGLSFMALCGFVGLLIHFISK